MSKPHSFLARYLILFGGETFSKLCVMAAFAFLARVLTQAEYGTVELALAITVFFVLGVESGMGLYGARIVAAHPERMPELIPRVMVLRAALGIPAFAIILAVAAWYESAGLGILAVNGIAILLTPFLTQWVFQGLRQMHLVAAGTALRNFTFVVLVIALMRPGSDIRLVAVAEVSGIAVLALFNMILLRRTTGVGLVWGGLGLGVRRVFGEVWFMGLSDFTWACLWYSPTLLVSWMAAAGTVEVAWIGSAVRIVLAVHTFVFLYFFNLLPNLARELVDGPDGWRDVMRRSIATSMWPACLIAVGGTVIAPLMIPAIYGPAYEAAVRPFQIAIWMIPVAWFSGHFRFSLIAAGQQRWEFAASAAAGIATVVAGLVLGRLYGATGAAMALLVGGVCNAVLAVIFSDRRVHSLATAEALWPVTLATCGSLVLGIAASSMAGPFLGATLATVVFAVIAIRQENDLIRTVRQMIGR